MASEEPWFQVWIDADLQEGIDARALANLLSELTTTSRIVAGQALSLPEVRGPMSAAERRLAAFRVTGISPGSVIIEMTQPTAVATQLTLELPITPDQIANSLVKDIDTMSRGDRPEGANQTRVQALTRLLRAAGRIGPHAEFTHRDSRTGELSQASVSLDDGGVRIPPASDDLQLAERILFGHVYMADVEFGRQRLRVKLPNERDLTMEVAPEVLEHLPRALDRLVELHVSEATRDGKLVERVVSSFRMIDEEESGPIRPDRDVYELAAAQGLNLQAPPDYHALITALLPTDQEEVRFAEFLDRRRAG